MTTSKRRLALLVVAVAACATVAFAVQLARRQAPLESGGAPPPTLREPLVPKLTVELLPGDRLRIDGVEADLREVRIRSQSLHAREPDAQVLLIATAAIDTSDLVAAIEQLHLGGLRNIVFSAGPAE